MPIIPCGTGEVLVKSLVSRVEDAPSRTFLEARVEIVGEDVVVAVGGGERPHVGCVVTAQPCRSNSRPGEWTASCSVLTIPPHKEEPIARTVATRIVESIGAGPSTTSVMLPIGIR